MRNVMIGLIGLAIASNAMAYDAVQYSAAIEYAYTNQGAVMGKNFALSADGDGGSLMICRWELPVEKPTLAALDAVMTAALAWKSNHVAEAIADVDNMTPQFKDVLRALVKVINLRLPAGNKITEAELKAAIKAEALKP